MSTTSAAYLTTITSALMANGGHRTYWDLVMAAIAETANDVGDQAAGVASYYDLVQASYTLMLSVSGGSLGTGYDQADVPLRNALGSGAFANMSQFAIRRVTTKDATYQILPQDFWTEMLLTTSGTRTYTLPAWTDMPDFVPALSGKNRSGNNLTLAPTGSDTINGAGASITIATANSYDIYKSDTSGAWEVRVYA